MSNEFKIKKGFVSEGNSKVNGVLSAQTINITTTPVLNTSATDILVRNNSTGVVEYRPVSGITGSTDVFVTGTTFTSNEAVLTRNDSADIFKLSGGTNVTLSNPSSNQIKIDVSLPPSMNTFITGFTYNNANTFTISRNDGVDLNSSFNTVTGLTVNGTLIVDTLSATTYTGLTLNDLDDVTTNIPTTPNVTYQGELLYFDTVSNQWVSGEEYGNLGDVTIWGKKGSAGTIDKGSPVYIVGFDSDLHEVELANATTGSTMPVIGFTAEDFDNAGVYPIVTFGKISGVDTTSGSTILNPFSENWEVNDVLYVAKSDGGLTKNRPSGSDTQIQRVAKILNVGTTSGQIFIFNTARTAGLPNLTTDYLWVGNGNDTPQEVVKTDVGITTTGFTYNNNNTLSITDDNGGSLSTTINEMSGLTVNGTLDATTILSGGTNLTTIIESLDTYVTGGTVSIPATDNTNSAIIGLLYKNSEGVPHTLPFEDTYTSGTTFNSNQASLTRNDGTDVLLLTGGTNVTLSNPSANKIKIDVSSSSSSIETGNILWVDNIFGDNATALVDRQDKPWASIAVALTNASLNDTIIVRPGEYVEPDFTLVPGTSLISQGGPKVTYISASTNTGNFITVSGSSYMEGFTIYTPTDDSAALYYNDPSGNVVTSINDVHFKGSSITGGTGVTLGKGLLMDSGLDSTSKIIYREFRYAGGNLNVLSEINGGIFALDGMHVPGGGTINKSIQMNGGRAQLININVGNPNCNTALSVSGTSSNFPNIVGFGVNLFNVPVGLEITSNFYDVELQNGRIEGGVNDILISSGLTGSNGRLNITSFSMDSTKIIEPYTWLDSEHKFIYSDIGISQNVENIYRNDSNLVIGKPSEGSGLAVGEGTEYQNLIHVHSSGSTGEKDLTLSAKTKGVNWSFGALLAGEQLYIGSEQQDSNGDYINWAAFELTYTGFTGGTYTIEYYSGGTWVDVKYQVTNSDKSYNYANKLFGRSIGVKEDVRIGYGDVGGIGWSDLTLFTHTCKWMRITMVTPPSSLPQFDLFWLENSHTKINKNGIISFFGDALYKDTLISSGNAFGESGGVVDASVPVGSGGLPTGWNHVIKNSKLNQNGDAIYLQAALPKGVCTAYPVDITLYYGLDPGDSSSSFTVAPKLITSFLARGASGNFVADPTGGLLPTPRTIENTETLTSSPGSAVTSDLVETGLPIATYAGKALSIRDITFDIDDYYEGDGFLLRIELDDDGTPNNDIVIFAVEVNVVKWVLGERIRV